MPTPGLNEELGKALLIMNRYGVPESDQLTIIKILVDAGVEKCLDEQQKIREDMDKHVQKAYIGPGLVH